VWRAKHRLTLAATPAPKRMLMNPPADKPFLFVTRRLTANVEARLTRDYRVRWNEDDRPLDADDLVRGAADADAVVCCLTEKFTAEVIARLPASVRLLSTVSVGTDHIDLGAARERGLTVTSTPGAVTEPTAEITLLLLLAAARRASEGAAAIREERWTGWSPTWLLGRSVAGKRLGIVGLGRIGQAVAQRARAFGMEIHYFNRRRLSVADEAGAIFHPSLESLLPVCDFLSLHAPGGQRVLDAAAIARLPRGAIVVNTARGDLVDDDALIAALRDGRLGAAGLDVFAGEPRIHPGYRELPNVFLLPHMGTSTVEARDAMGHLALDNVDAALAGRRPPGLVVGK